jgi:hypothetical protein
MFAVEKNSLNRIFAGFLVGNHQVVVPKCGVIIRSWIVGPVLADEDILLQIQRERKPTGSLPAV